MSNSRGRKIQLGAMMFLQYAIWGAWAPVLSSHLLGDLAGDARELAAEHAQFAMDIAAGRGPVAPPCVILSGGETTVRITGNGRGGCRRWRWTSLRLR